MIRTENTLLELYLTYDQWKEEHDDLRERLLELCRLLAWHPARPDHRDPEKKHLEAREKIIPFMKDWRRHLAKERKMVYPAAKCMIRGGAMSPVAVLEQDSIIAGQYYEAYLQAVKDGTTAADALSRLLQVVMIAAEHFRVEDEILLPVTGQLMEDMEYAGS